MIVLKATHSHSSYIENKGSGKFEIRPLPDLVQVAPINGMVVLDANDDGNLDVAMVGNDYGNEVFSGRYDACRGIVLLGDGRGNFKVTSSVNSGFEVEGDGKALSKLNSITGPLLIATQNTDSLRIFRLRKDMRENERTFTPLKSDSWATFSFANGKKTKVEFYYGSGYLSQSSRVIRIPIDVTEMMVYDFAGKSRTVDFKGLAFSRP
jgi:hypothetical protein